MREVATGRDVAIKKFKSRPDDLGRAARLAGSELAVVDGIRCHHGILPEELAIDAVRHKAFLVFPFVAGVTLAKACEVSEDEDILRRGDMTMLWDTMWDLWPWPRTQACRSFFNWFKKRIAASETTQIAQDALKQPFLVLPDPSQDSA